MNSFGAILKNYRLTAGFTQEKLAEELGVSIISVQNWESGKNKIRMDKLQKLSYLFTTPLETLIHDMLISDDVDSEARFPYFLFDNDTKEIVQTLHLSLSQQELFGILYIYHAEFLEHTEMDSADLIEDLKLIPYEFVRQFGSIKLLNIAEGLYHVLKYVQTDYLIKVLRLNPDKEFDIRRLSKELICDFIDGGYKNLDESDWAADSDHALSFNVNMHKAKKFLPLLENVPVRLTNGSWANALADDIPDWILNYDDNIPEYLKCRRNEIPEWWSQDTEAFEKEWDRYHNTSRIRHGIESLTDYKENSDSEWILSIGEKGKKLLDWFREN